MNVDFLAKRKIARNSVEAIPNVFAGVPILTAFIRSSHLNEQVVSAQRLSPLLLKNVEDWHLHLVLPMIPKLGCKFFVESNPGFSLPGSLRSGKERKNVGCGGLLSCPRTIAYPISKKMMKYNS